MNFHRVIGCLGVAIIVALGNSAMAATLAGRVVSVADGDTVTVLEATNQQFKIRLAGIDAPEKRQAFGQRSKQSLSGMVMGRDVRLEYEGRDRYGRIVGKILVDGRGACLAQVRSGMAWHYKKYQADQSPADRVAYAAEEDGARSRREGLWSDPYAEPPWTSGGVRKSAEVGEDRGRGELRRDDEISPFG